MAANERIAVARRRAMPATTVSVVTAPQKSVCCVRISTQDVFRRLSKKRKTIVGCNGVDTCAMRY